MMWVVSVATVRWFRMQSLPEPSYFPSLSWPCYCLHSYCRCGLCHDRIHIPDLVEQGLFLCHHKYAIAPPITSKRGWYSEFWPPCSKRITWYRSSSASVGRPWKSALSHVVHCTTVTSREVHYLLRAVHDRGAVIRSTKRTSLRMTKKRFCVHSLFHFFKQPGYCRFEVCLPFWGELNTLWSFVFWKRKRWRRCANVQVAPFWGVGIYLSSLICYTSLSNISNKNCNNSPCFECSPWTNDALRFARFNRDNIFNFIVDICIQRDIAYISPHRTHSRIPCVHSTPLCCWSSRWLRLRFFLLFCCFFRNTL